jgi:hypothetical protein
MSESREDLIARRDALIEQLQGEWMTKRAIVVPLYNALELTKLITLGMGGVMIATAAIAIVANLVLGNDMSRVTIPSLLLFTVGSIAGLGSVAFVLFFFTFFWTGQFKPIWVENSILCVSGQKLSEVSLCHLTHYWTPHDEESDRADRRACLRPVWVGHWRERWDLDRYWLYPVRIRPCGYEKGHQLVELLDQIASVNDELATLES